MFRRHRKIGFTLVELLVVIAIIGILVALLLPAIQAAREAARRTECANKIKQVALGMQNYHDTYGKFPALGVRGMGNNTGIYYSWCIPILPFIEEQPLLDGIMVQARPAGTGLPTPWHTGNDAFANTYWKVDIDTFMCPSDPPMPDRRESPSTLNYKACVGDDYHQNHFRPDQSQRDNRGIFQIERWTPMAAITDGTSTTAMVGEIATGGDRYDIKGGVAVNMQAWNPASCLARVDINDPKRLTDPVRAQFRPHGGRAWDGRPYFVGFATLVGPNGPSCHWGGVDGNEHMGTVASWHPGGGHIAMADGSVHFIDESINTGAQAVDDVDYPGSRESPWGTWGAMGSMSGHESVSGF